MQSITILAVLAIVFSCTLASDVTLDRHWKLWKQMHKKEYSDEEESVRRGIWESNLQIVHEHNFDADMGIHSYWLGMNQFADMTVDEFIKQIKAHKGTPGETERVSGQSFTFNSSILLPDTVDWREKGCVTAVKNQGQCGASYAFSSVGAVEGDYCVRIGKLVPLSQQQLLDCGKMGCTGGTTDQAFDAIKKMGGLEPDSAYPYDPTGECHLDPTKIVAKITGYVDVTSGNENTLEQAVATIGPIAVAIDASHASFQLYRSGVYDEPGCSSTAVDHSVLTVGYGVELGKDYWLVKNSWGTSWGDEGYIKMSRNKKNQCGIATDASYPTF